MSCKRKIISTKTTNGIRFDNLECGHFIEMLVVGEKTRHCWKCAANHPAIGDLDAIIKRGKK